MSAPSSIAVVVGGGPISPAEPPAGSPAGSPTGSSTGSFVAVIAADSGLDVALAAGLQPTVLVGDLDSISPHGVDWAADHGVPVEQHDPDKDDTDTALALHCAAAMRASSGAQGVVVLGGHTTDRLDHLLATVVCLGDPVLELFERVTARLGSTEIRVLHPGRCTALTLAAGRVFSLLALHGDCTGVEVRDARWPLHDAVLRSGSTLGVSNESLGRPVTIGVHGGVLTVIVPAVAA